MNPSFIQPPQVVWASGALADGPLLRKSTRGSCAGARWRAQEWCGELAFMMWKCLIPLQRKGR
jgi:hypothetical protein